MFELQRNIVKPVLLQGDGNGGGGGNGDGGDESEAISRFGPSKSKISLNLPDKSGGNSSLSQLEQPKSKHNLKVSF